MNLDQLHNIQQVEAPNYLYANIQEIIKQKKANKLSMPISIGIAGAFVMLLFFNAVTLFTNNTCNQKTNLAETLGLNNNINLYSNE